MNEPQISEMKSRRIYARSNSREVSRGPCPECGSKDGCVEYSDGHRFCHACETTFPPSWKAASAARPDKRDAPPMDIQKRWKSAIPIAGARHSYLRRKGGLIGFGLRRRGGMLIAPIRTIDGKLVSLQFIPKSGRPKKLARGRELGDGFFSHGKYRRRIYLCEGVADALTIYGLTKELCVAAMSAYRMVRVAKVLRDSYPDAEIVVVGDNDAK